MKFPCVFCIYLLTNVCISYATGQHQIFKVFGGLMIDMFIK